MLIAFICGVPARAYLKLHKGMRDDACENYTTQDSYKVDHVGTLLLRPVYTCKLNCRFACANRFAQAGACVWTPKLYTVQANIRAACATFNMS